MDRITIAVLAVVALLGGAVGAGATDVTTCGQAVAARDTGVLVADLTCPSSAIGVFVQDRATLDLGGHTLTGGGVECVSSCTIRNGTVTQVHPQVAVFAGTGPIGRAKFTGENLTLQGSTAGIVSQTRKVLLTNVNASNNLGDGIQMRAAKTVRGQNVTANANVGHGVWLGSEVGSASLKITALTAIGNGQAGLINNGKTTVLVGSTLTGNEFGPFPGAPTLVDIATRDGRCPKLVSTVCDHSFSDPPCYVCSGD